MQVVLFLALTAVSCTGSVISGKHKHGKLRPWWVRTSTSTARPRPTTTTMTTTTVTAVTAPSEGWPLPLVTQREDAEAEQLELGMAERLDDKRFQESEKRRVNTYNTHDEYFEVYDEENQNGTCLYVMCSAGRECEVDERGEVACACVKSCPFDDAAGRQVCSNYNETWPSDCDVYQQRCLCLDSPELCRDNKYQHMHIAHYGPCRKMPECSAQQMAELPRRMREWVAGTLRDLAEGRDLMAHYLAVKHEAQSSLAQRWTKTSIWKWCNVDADDNNRFVSVHEVFPLRAALAELQHCVSAFLARCDDDDDHRLSVAEWTRCLQLDKSELEDQCNEFADERRLMTQWK